MHLQGGSRVANLYSSGQCVEQGIRRNRMLDPSLFQKSAELMNKS
jgi:hypothetical protein